MSSVFICHFRGDRAAVRVLADSLHRLPAVRAFLDEEHTGGEAWWAKILEHIRRCTVFVFAVSDASLQSTICQAQLAYAQALGLPILSVQVAAVHRHRLDPALSRIIDFRHPDATSGMNVVAALQESASQRTELPDPLPAPPPIPYNYLSRLQTSLRAAEPLSPSAQNQVVSELKSALDQAHDETVQDDVRRLLGQLRRRDDCTLRTVSQIDAILDTDALEPGAAPEAEAPSRHGERQRSAAYSAKPAPAPRQAWISENAQQEVRKPTRARVTRAAPTKKKRSHAANYDVDCSVFAPEAMSPGSRAMVQVFVHLPEQASLATRMARSLDPRTKRRGSCTLEVPITHGEHLTFELTMPGLDVPTPVKQLRWTGGKAFVQFEVIVPAQVPIGESIVGTVTARRRGVAIGTLMFSVQIDPGAAGTLYKILGDGAKRYSRAFISYASEDRAHVLARVQMLRIANIDYFQDIDMEPGKRWENELYRQIDRCDLFLLFWSQAAKESEWVRKETQYALGLGKKAPDVKPVPIEGPPVASPWEELQAIHVNDALLAHLAVAARLS